MRGRDDMTAAATGHERGTVLLTDYAWPDLTIEQESIEGAGFELVAGPAVAASAATIEALVRRHEPLGILSNWAPLTAAAVAASARLRIIARLGVGLDNIAVDEATHRGIWVTNVPDFCVEEVSDHAIGLLLAWARGIVQFNAETHAGTWRPATARLQRVGRLTCGLVGYGRIGQRIAQKLAPFGNALFATTARPRPGDGLVEMLPLDDLLRRSQVVIVTAPLSPRTHHLLNAARLALLPPGAFVINVSRGGLIDTPALLAALAAGDIAGAGLDVIEGEPVVSPELAAEPRVILTPHIAFASDAAIADLRRRACAEVVRVLRGERPLEARNEPDLGACAAVLRAPFPD